MTKPSLAFIGSGNMAAALIHGLVRDGYPSNLINWVNVAAEDDYTCHDETMANDYGRMLQTQGISRIQDYRIYNLAARYGRSNPHHAVGYLIHPRVAAIVGDWLQDG